MVLRLSVPSLQTALPSSRTRLEASSIRPLDR
jgi:hypothetical protein